MTFRRPLHPCRIDDYTLGTWTSLALLVLVIPLHESTTSTLVTRCDPHTFFSAVSSLSLADLTCYSVLSFIFVLGHSARPSLVSITASTLSAVMENVFVFSVEDITAELTLNLFDLGVRLRVCIQCSL